MSDEEREVLNQVTEDGSQLLIASHENLKKNRYTIFLWLNSAKKQLVLSAPSLLNESESKESVYLKELQDFGLPRLKRESTEETYQRMILALITVCCLVLLLITSMVRRRQVTKT